MEMHGATVKINNLYVVITSTYHGIKGKVNVQEKRGWKACK
jgi:hypothetical protein